MSINQNFVVRFFFINSFNKFSMLFLLKYQYICHIRHQYFILNIYLTPFNSIILYDLKNYLFTLSKKKKNITTVKQDKHILPIF